MKRGFFVYFVLLLTFFGSTLSAQDGYKGPGADIVTVEAAKNLRDDHPVTIKGKIEKSLGDEKYLFADDTGNIVIEIDNKLWRGISVDQNDVVEISGEVDKEFMKVEIDVSSIKKI
jgi:uncharacterized protein (TIGR00156 family)